MILACNNSSENSKYPRHVGDIAFDEKNDNVDFEICNGEDEVKQYFNFSQGLKYEGEKLAIIEKIEANYKPIQNEKETGLIRIRFIVNCRGQTGRFRVIGMNKDYQEKEFDSAIVNQLLSITKQMSGWKILPDTSKPHDYYQYLIFKMESGHIKEILP